MNREFDFLRRILKRNPVKVETLAAAYMCSGCWSSRPYGVKVTSHMSVGADGVLRECSGVGFLPIPRETVQGSVRKT